MRLTRRCSLAQPPTRSQQTQRHAQISAIRMSVLADFAQCDPRRRRTEKPEDAAIGQRGHCRRQHKPGQVSKNGRSDGCFFVFHRQLSNDANVTTRARELPTRAPRTNLALPRAPSSCGPPRSAAASRIRSPDARNAGGRTQSSSQFSPPAKRSTRATPLRCP